MEIASQLSALGDPTRRAVFEAIARRPQSVAELAGQLPVSRPAVSQHLKVLHTAGLVQFERIATRSIYEIDRAGLAYLRSYVDGLWTDALDSLKSLSESTWPKIERKEQK